MTGGNPLAVLGQAARVTMIKASANVKLLVGQMREAEEKIDNDVAKLFDEILDEGVSSTLNISFFTQQTLTIFNFVSGTKMLGQR